jgi:PAS domain S-box-containing protein
MNDAGKDSKELSMVLSTLRFGTPEASYDSVYVVQSGKFRYVNPQFAAVGGYTEKEMLGMESVSLIHPEDRQKAKENALKMLKGESTSPYQFRMIAKGGSVQWIQETVHAITYKGKRAVLGNSMDITVQREAAEKLQEFQAMQNALLDALPIAVTTNRPVSVLLHPALPGTVESVEMQVFGDGAPVLLQAIFADSGSRAFASRIPANSACR